MIYTAFGGQSEHRGNYDVTIIYKKVLWEKYVMWVYENTEKHSWEWRGGDQRIEKVKGVWLSEEDTIMFKLKFGL